MVYLFRTAFGDDADRVVVTPATNAPVLRLGVPQSVVDGVPVSEATLTRIFAQAMPCGTDITIITDDVFTFVADGEDAPPFAGGFGEGEWAGSDE
jgi:hypothetical protein